MEQLKKYMDYFIESKSQQYRLHYRFIGAEGTDDAFVSHTETPWHKHPLRGWGKPDREIHGVEMRYLWKQFEPLTFEQWKQQCTG